MKSVFRSLALGLFVTFLSQANVHSQDTKEDSLDFSDLDKVEKDEFGGDSQGQDTGDFDLESDPQKKKTESTELDDLDKEMNELEGPSSKPGSDTVDLDKELETDEAQKQATEPVPPPEAPPLEAPEAPQQAEQLPPPPVEPPQEQSAPVVAESGDEPNAKLEARLNRIYEKFMTEKTSDEEWMQKVQGTGEKAAENYAVQQGDTLWDISVTFFGTGYFWPKIWQLNDDITNPHSIRPGKVIRFIPGTLESAPQMQVTDGEGTTEQSLTQGEAPIPIEDQSPQIPPPLQVSRPALKRLPPSLPYITYQDDEEYDKEGFALEKQKSSIQQSAIALSGYLSETMPNSVGEVVSIEQMGASTAATHQYIYVKLQSAQIGETLTAYGVGKKAEYNNKKVGLPIDYQGRVKIIERANDKESVYKAIVISSLGQVAIGSQLTKESIPQISMGSEGKLNTAFGEVIGGAFDHDRRLIADGAILYLNIGANQGLSAGDLMTVVRNDKARNPKSPVTMNSKKIGTIKIAKVTPTLATAVVLQTTDEIVPGDNVGGVSAGGDSTEREMIYYDPGDESNPDSSSDDIELE